MLGIPAGNGAMRLSGGKRPTNGYSLGLREPGLLSIKGNELLAYLVQFLFGGRNGGKWKNRRRWATVLRRLRSAGKALSTATSKGNASIKANAIPLRIPVLGLFFFWRGVSGKRRGKKKNQTNPKRKTPSKTKLPQIQTLPTPLRAERCGGPAALPGWGTALRCASVRG